MMLTVFPRLLLLCLNATDGHDLCTDDSPRLRLPKAALAAKLTEVKLKHG